MANREQNKSQRRSDIVASARALMEEAGQAALSMRALAERAGVSMATPYNLFGSKQAILISVLDADLADYQAALDELRTEGVDALFEAVAVMGRMFAREPDFYRNVISAVCTDGGPELRFVISGPRYALWKTLLGGATDAGALDDGIDPDAFAVTLSQLLFANIQEWALGYLSLEEMQARVRYGLALTLLAIATVDSRARLKRLLRESEQDLQALWRQALEQRLHDGPLDEDTRAILADQLRHLESNQQLHIEEETST